MATTTMIIFLYGQDIYRSRKRLKEIIEEYKTKNPDWFNIIRIDAKEKETDIVEKIKNSTSTVSMFEQNKLIIIENPFSLNKEEQKRIIEILKQTKENTTTMLWTEETDKKTSLFKHLIKNSKTTEYSPLEGAKLKTWIQDYIKKEKIKIEPKALTKIIEFTGNDLWRITNELEKLSTYKNNKEIKEEDIDKLIKPKIDIDIFKLIDAMAQKNKAKAIFMTRQYLEKGENEQYLLSMLAYQFRNILKVKEYKPQGFNYQAGAKKLKMHPFVFKKTTQTARNFSPEELKKIYSFLLAIDLDLKTGKIEAGPALDLFISTL
ncbi:MAG: DNA polymerase III subunit delta [Candidatus Portnoybacteria bacterium]|nr:DNA polymerase III subunit delta [Candidatus Portnoybacteria bacterium]